MIYKLVHIILGLFFIHTTMAQVTFVIENLPEAIASDESIYISGDFENWSGGQEDFKLSNKNNRYFITIEKQKTPISFKFTKGSWDSVERDLEGNNIENRTYSFVKKKDSVSVKIQNWSSVNKKKSTANCQVAILTNNFKIPQLNRERRIWIYLPPNYQESNQHYPVLYMHDGQNLFDESTAYSGEWGIDETLNKLSEKHAFNLIVIGIDNGQETRLNEYSPWDNSKFGTGEGESYIQFIVNTLKPYIDDNFRTLPEKEHTGIMGSSMGGLISHYAGLSCTDIFTKVGVFSPSFWYAKSSFDLATISSKVASTKMYFLVGTKEGTNMVSDMKKMVKTMKKNGFEEENIKSKIVQGAQHNEQFWRAEFEEAVLWLFDR